MENSATNSFTKQAHETALSYTQERGLTDDQYSLEESQSGWTDYLDDFGRENSCCTSTLSDFGSSSSSMVSDAASYAAWKLLGKAEVRLEKTCKNLNFKKRRTRDHLNDDALEDTASSPVNSPKVSDLSQFHMSPRRKFENGDISQLQEKRNNGTSEKRNKGTSGHGLDLQTTEQRNHEMDCSSNGWMGNDQYYCTQLKKRGLCLVPLSMLINYRG